MTKDKQRIAIAEFCGWKWARYTLHGDLDYRLRKYLPNSGWVWEEPKVALTTEVALENTSHYSEDLNTIHEAEKLLTDVQRTTYIEQLSRVIGPIIGWRGASDSWLFVNATASQRAEALLRTIGKWEDD